MESSWSHRMLLLNTLFDLIEFSEWRLPVKLYHPVLFLYINWTEFKELMREPLPLCTYEE